MERSVKGYVAAAPSVHSMTIRFAATSNNPHRPWSVIALDFVTRLPVSSAKSLILSFSDRFSKSAHFIALDKLLIDHVFRHYGIPTAIVLNPLHRSGRPSVLLFEPKSASALDITHNLMDRPRGSARCWNQPSTMSPHKTR